jgi:hypothetical protein
MAVGLKPVGERHGQIHGPVLHWEALNLHGDVSKGAPEKLTPSHSLQARTGHIDSGINLHLLLKKLLAHFSRIEGD